jgi:hypothetical protein
MIHINNTANLIDRVLNCALIRSENAFANRRTPDGQQRLTQTVMHQLTAQSHILVNSLC